MDVLLGISLAATGLIFGFVWYDREDRRRVLREIELRKDELKTLLTAVQESHNSVTEANRIIDAKVVELGLRLSQMGAPQNKTPKTFTGF